MILELRNLTKDFAAQGSVVHRAVEDLSLGIAAGEFCTLLGPSGCGKTTLLRMIAGFETPTSGEILLDGRTINDVAPYRRGLPMVFQSYALFPHLDVFENVAYGLRARKLSRADVAARTAHALELLNLMELRERLPAKLSGGQQQRVALARCLVLEPRMILLDEPLSNLDAELRVSMRREIRSLQQRLGITSIYVTHDQEEAMAISDRIVVMNRGRIEQSGSPAEIHQRPATEFVARFVGASNVLSFERIDPDRILLLGSVVETAAARAGTTRVVVRPEAVEIGRSAARFHGIVIEAVFLGARVQLQLELEDGTRLSATSNADGGATAYSEGDVVAFDIPAERLHFI